MHHIARACLFSIALAVTGAALARAGDVEPVAVPDRAGRDALYAWLDDVGYPDGVGRPTVWLTTWGEPELAFVTAQDDASSTVFALTGRVVTLTPGAEKENGVEPPSVSDADLAAAVAQRLHDRERETASEERFAWGSPYELSERTRYVLLARLAHRTDDDALEERLLAAAAATPGTMEWVHDRSGRPLDELVRRDVELFERVSTWDAFAALPSLAERRAVLLRYARLFPESDFAERAKEQAAVLDAMAENTADVPTDEQLAKLEGDALARGLVLRLRDQAAWAEAMGGAIAHMNGSGESALDRLIAMGDAALPALLDAMDDPTLTRVVSHGRTDVHPTVHTVGNLARDGVQAITGQWFGNAQEGRDWLARRSEEGEGALVAAQVFRDTWIDVTAARRLVEVDPATAAHTLGELMGREMSDGLRLQLLRELGAAKHPDVVPILRAEGGADRRFAVRQTAAQALAAHDPEAARDIVLDLWRTDAGLVPLTYPAAAADSDRYWEREAAWNGLVRQLVAAEVWDEILAELPKKTPTTRATLLRTLANAAPDPFAGGALSRALVDGMLDGGAAPYGLGASGLGNCPDARICDLVGAELASRREEWRPFPASAVRESRDVLLAEIRNALRAALGEEAETVPSTPPREVRGDADVAPLVAAFETADLAALDRAEDAVAAAGLPALPALRRALDALPPDAPGRTALERGVGRLATTVGRVIVRDGVDAETGAALGPFAGRPLDVDALVAALRARLEAGHALTLLVHRPADDTGCAIAVGPPPAGTGMRLEMNGDFSQTSHRDLDDGAWDAVHRELVQGVRAGVARGWAVGIRLR